MTVIIILCQLSFECSGFYSPSVLYHRQMPPLGGMVLSVCRFNINCATLNRLLLAGVCVLIATSRWQSLEDSWDIAVMLCLL